MKTLKVILREHDLRKKCMMTLVILIVCQVVTGLPTPGVDTEFFLQLTGRNGALGFLDMLTGNGLSRMSIGALGITPYITASIVIQLLGLVIPRIKEMQKDGKDGQRKLELATIISGTVLSLLQGILMATSFGKSGLLLKYTWYWCLLAAFVWACGTLFLSLAGKLIKDKYFGNGISLILVSSILSSYPSSAANIYQVFLAGRKPVILALVLLGLLLFLFSIFFYTVALQEGQKNLNAVYSKKAGNYPMRSEIPIKLCPGSVVPVIFASTVISIPVLIAQFAGANNWVINMLNTSAWFDPANPSYSIGALLYIAMIFGFALFYARIVFNPMEIANNLKKSGAMIPGIRPGKPTADYIDNQMKWTVAFGGVALCFIALIPLIVSGIFGTGRLAFLGTSLIIVAGVILETRKQLTASTKCGIYMEHIRKGGIFHA